MDYIRYKKTNPNLPWVVEIPYLYISKGYETKELAIEARDRALVDGYQLPPCPSTYTFIVTDYEIITRSGDLVIKREEFCKSRFKNGSLKKKSL